MATFQAQVQALTTITISSSSTYPTEGQLSQFLTDGAREIISILPASLLQYCIGSTRLDSSPSKLALSTDTDLGKILYVTHSNGTRQLPCRLIPAAYSGLASDSTSLTYFGSDSDPVYWIKGTDTSGDSTSIATILEVFPTPTEAKSANVYHVTYPAVVYSDSAISNFPDGAEYLVVLYASIKSLLSTIGAVEIPPSTFGDGTSMTSDATALSNEQIGADAEFLEFDQWFTALGEMIEDDEDVELAAAQIEKINAYVNTWNIQLQGNLAEMQQYMALFQALKADYNAGIAMLTGAATQPPAQQQRRGR